MADKGRVQLAAVYDGDNPDGPDHDFYRAMVQECGARRIIDLGCGTGLLTITLTDQERRVTGIDPTPEMLDIARQRPGGESVTWVLGTAEEIAPGSADVVLMSGNVAMHILGESWHDTLRRIAAGLVPGGRLLFETRNPDAQAWERWTHPLVERETAVGTVREATVTDPPDGNGVVVMHCHHEFLGDGTVLDIDQPLQFRSRREIAEDLSRAGLRIVDCWRSWDREPFTGGADQPLMIVIAER